VNIGVRQVDLVSGYTGYSYDQVLGQYYAKARMYDADSRRFTAADPVKGTVQNTQSMAQYTYCLNNPLKYTDPTGRLVSDWDKAHLSAAEQAQLDANTAAWNAANASGDKAAMAAAHASSEAIRNQYRTGTEQSSASQDGNTVGTPAQTVTAPPMNNPVDTSSLDQTSQDALNQFTNTVNSYTDGNLIDMAVSSTNSAVASIAKAAIASLDMGAKARAAATLRQQALQEAAKELVNNVNVSVTPPQVNGPNKYGIGIAFASLDPTAGIASASKTTSYNVMLDYIVDKNNGTMTVTYEPSFKLFGLIPIGSNTKKPIITVEIGDKTATYTATDGIKQVDDHWIINNQKLMDKNGLGLTKAQSTHLAGDLFNSQEDADFAANIMGLFKEDGDYVDKITNQDDGIKYSFLVEPPRPSDLNQYKGENLTEKNITSFYFATEDEAVRAFAKLYGPMAKNDGDIEYGAAVYRYEDGSFSLSVNKGKESRRIVVDHVITNTVALIHTHPDDNNFTYYDDTKAKPPEGDDYGWYMNYSIYSDESMERSYLIIPNGSVMMSERISPDMKIPDTWYFGELGQYGEYQHTGNYYTIGEEIFKWK